MITLLVMLCVVMIVMQGCDENAVTPQPVEKQMKIELTDYNNEVREFIFKYIKLDGEKDLMQVDTDSGQVSIPLFWEGIKGFRISSPTNNFIMVKITLIDSSYVKYIFSEAFYSQSENELKWMMGVKEYKFGELKESILQLEFIQ